MPGLSKRLFPADLPQNPVSLHASSYVSNFILFAVVTPTTSGEQ